MASKKTVQHDNLKEIESALTKTEQFIEDHQTKMIYGIGIIVLIVVSYLAFTRFYMKPRENEAKSQMYKAEQYFEKDSFNLALNGDGNYLGFLDIIDDYSITPQAKLARYYAGLSYLYLGQFDDAIDYLDGFKTKDIILKPVALGSLGDAYLEKGEESKALNQYDKAISASDNEMSTPFYLMKAGKLSEKLNKPEKALEYYTKIKEKYPSTNEGRAVDKYIARINSTKLIK
jgi:tetratricopeptide (TPR) repeat protein